MPITIVSNNARLNHSVKRNSLWGKLPKPVPVTFSVYRKHIYSSQLCPTVKTSIILTYFTHVQTKKRGLKIAVKDNRCFLILVCSINNALYTLLNIYAPSKQQITFLTKT